MYGLEYSLYLLYTILGGLGIDLGLKIFMENQNRLATARMGRKSDFKKITGTDGIQLSQKYQLREKYDYEGICVVAPTGAGKTTSHHIPNLLQNNIKGSLIINDPKGELWKLTHKYQESIGRKTILFKPLESGGTNYNPYKECENVREVSQLAQNLLINGALAYEIATGKKSNNTEWLQMCQNLFTAALLYKNTNIQEALYFVIENDNDKIDEVLSKSGHDIRMQYNIFKTSLDSPKTMASIKITFASTLSLFTDNLAINRSDFHAKDLREKPIALYISYPENKSSYLSPFMSAFYSQFIDKLIDLYDKDSLPITLFLDEFGNLGRLSNCLQNVSTGRSRAMCFDICLQSITQLEELYGDKTAKSILNNLKTKVILPGLSDVDTLKFISDICGYKEVKIRDDKDHVSTMTKDLFTSEEVRCLDDDWCLIVHGNKFPVLDHQNVYYKNPKYQGVL